MSLAQMTAYWESRGCQLVTNCATGVPDDLVLDFKLYRVGVAHLYARVSFSVERTTSISDAFSVANVKLTELVRWMETNARTRNNPWTAGNRKDDAAPGDSGAGDSGRDAAGADSIR